MSTACEPQGARSRYAYRSFLGHGHFRPKFKPPEFEKNVTGPNRCKSLQSAAAPKLDKRFWSQK